MEILGFGEHFQGETLFREEISDFLDMGRSISLTEKSTSKKSIVCDKLYMNITIRSRNYEGGGGGGVIKARLVCTFYSCHLTKLAI